MAGGKTIAFPVTMDTTRTHPSESGVPPVASRQQQRSQPHPTPSTVLLIPPPHQSAQGTLAYALTDPPAHPTSLPQVRPRKGTVGHPYMRSDVHPHLHAVDSPPFAFPRYMGLHRQEENMRYLAYIPHAPIYQYPTPSHHFPPMASAPSSPIYPHTLNNTFPPPNSLPPPQHTESGPSRSTHSPPYVIHGAYTPMGYTTHPPYVYPPPASSVPALYTYGPHSPPHYFRPYDLPPGQESQGTWWYAHPGPSVAANSSETQREFQPQLADGYPPPGQPEGENSGQRNAVPLLSEPQPTRSPTTQIRPGRSLNTVNQEATQPPSPTSPTSPRTKNQGRRSYHPNPPADRSEWVMWVGNVPSDAKRDELRDFFNQPLLRSLSPTSTEPTEDGQQLYGGVSTIFIMSRTNCAFVNFETEAQLEAATVRFNGQPIRPHDPCCLPLVCRVRRREDVLMAGVGGQRGSGMHIKWVKERKAKVQADTVGSQKDMVRSSSPLSVSSRGRREGRFTNTNFSRSASIASTSSDILAHYFPKRYFVLKSLTRVCIPPLLDPTTISNSHVGSTTWT